MWAVNCLSRHLGTAFGNWTWSTVDDSGGADMVKDEGREREKLGA